ncbi:GPCR kinase [Tanacetum coccineum]
MDCSLSHTEYEVEALIQKLIDEDKVHQNAVLDLALQFKNSCTAKDDLKKAYEKCNDISQESRALIDAFLKEGSDKDYELNLSMYGKAAKIEKQMNAKLAWLLEKYNYRSQTHIDEEALKGTLEKQAMDEKAREKKIRQKQVDDDEFFFVFGVVRIDSDYEWGFNVTMKDLSGTIPGTIHHKVIGEGGYGKNITVGAAMILYNVSVFTPKPSQHYLNITMKNVVEVFRKDTLLMAVVNLSIYVNVALQWQKVACGDTGCVSQLDWPTIIVINHYQASQITAGQSGYDTQPDVPTLTCAPYSQMHNNIMAAGSKDRPPMLGPGRYSQWHSRFLRYLDTKTNGEYLRKCIFDGPYLPTNVLIAAVEAAETLYQVSAHERKTYDKVDGSAVFNLHKSINSLNQNNASLAEYYNNLNSLWKQFDAMISLPPCTCDDAKHFDQHNQLIKLMQFLIGLGESYLTIRSNLLTREPLPSVKTVFSVISGEESHRNISSIRTTKPAATSFVAKNVDNNKKRFNNNNNHKGFGNSN